LGYTYVLTVHGIPSVEFQLAASRTLASNLRLRLLRFVEHESVRRAETVIANSRYVLQRLPAGQRSRAMLIQNPVQAEFFEREVTESCPGRITWVGRLIPLKAVHVLIQLLPSLRRVCPVASLRLIGPEVDLVYADSLRALARETGSSEYVEFVGSRHGVALRAEYAAASVVALPSRQENVPTVIAEAMAVGRPVVAANVGGVAELVAHGITGTICPPADGQAMAEALSEILLDTAMRHRMGGAARREAVARFRVERIAKRHIEAYGSILNRKVADRTAKAPLERHQTRISIGAPCED
jgi:glycosyltransferase involved in cell wall biosynthesis